MKMFKTPIQPKLTTIYKKSPISFIKNIASPKENHQNHFNYSNLYQSEKVSHNTQNISLTREKFKPRHSESLSILLSQQSKQTQSPQFSDSYLNGRKSVKQKNTEISSSTLRGQFHYNSQTEIKHLVSFVYNQIQNKMVYLKSSNIYVDYILGLKEFKVKQLVELLKEQQLGKQYFEKNIKIELHLIYSQYKQIQNNNYLKNFEIIKCVGTGGFSKVYMVRGFGKIMAMKVIDKHYIITNDKTNIINNEKTILTICSDHPFITKLHASFETNNFLIFVMEFCNGGELFNLLRRIRRMNEQDAKFYFVETLAAVVHLHQKGIVYRDIKPENIMIDYQGHIRLVDYGLSKIMDQNRESKTYSFCGSAQYMAPQMLLKQGHSYQIDFYCLGALLYELVIGLPPYYSRNQNELFSNIIYNDLEFPEHVSLSNQLRNFLERLLQKDVKYRYKTIKEILSDPWMQNVKLQDVLDKKIKPPNKTDMFGYNFDDHDFADFEKQIIKKLRDQQQYTSIDEIKFPDFFYQSKQIKHIKQLINNLQQPRTFAKSSKNTVAETTLQSHQPRVKITNNQINRPLQESLHRESNYSMTNIQPITLPTRVEIPSTYHQPKTCNHMVYYPNETSPQLLHVRSLDRIKLPEITMMNVPEQKQNQNQRKSSGPTHTYNDNVYTLHRQNSHPVGLKVTSIPSLELVSSMRKNMTYIREGNNFTMQKSAIIPQGLRFEIEYNKIKTGMNFSGGKIREAYSPTSIRITRAQPSYLTKPNNISSQFKKSYLQGFHNKNIPNKIKKSSYKNIQKISITSMMNNLNRS